MVGQGRGKSEAAFSLEPLISGEGVMPGRHGINWRLRTNPQVLIENANMWPDKPALRKKRYGIWNSYTWKQYLENVKYFALGLASMGFGRNDKILIIGDNDPEWWFSELGAQCLGGVGVGVFIDCVASEVSYFCNTSDAVIAVAKDQEQCDKFVEIRSEIPKIRKVIYWEPKGMWKVKDPWFIDFQEVLELGRSCERSDPAFFERTVELGKVDDIACLTFTSGTTGMPKAAMLAYRNLIAGNFVFFLYYTIYPGEDYFSFLCPAWAVDQVIGFNCCLQQGVVVNFPESPATVQEDAREISSVVELAGARMWEERYRTLLSRINNADKLKKATYRWAMSVGRRYMERKQAKQLNLIWNVLYRLADLVAFRQLRDRLGYVKARCCFVAGAMMSPELFSFFQTIRIPLYTYYGTTEVGAVTMQNHDDIVRGSSGKGLAGREFQITGMDNEVVVKVDNAFTFRGYYNNPEATKKAIVDGWYRTGDAAYVDENGHLFFMDRISEMMALADGFKFSPTYMESEIRCSQYIADVMIVGQQKEFIAALIQIDLRNVGLWAEAHHIAYNTFVDLSQKEQVYDLIAGELRTINSRIPERSRVKVFANLHKEFDADEAEMTRTRKLRRAPLFVKYKDIIDGIYSGAPKVAVETEVKYRDGRLGTVRAEVLIQKV